MNEIVEPLQQSVLNRELSDPNLSHIRWLGFDKFENLIYGLRYGNTMYVEIVMLSVFTGEIKTIITWESCSGLSKISTCGQHIAMLVVRNEFKEKRRKHVFHVFTIETAERKNYEIFLPNINERNRNLSHSTAIGWIIIDLKISDKARVAIYTIYKVVIDEIDKTCSVEYLSEFRSFPNYKWPIMRKYEALFFSFSLNVLNIVKCQDLGVSTDTMLPTIEFDGEFDVLLSKDEQNIYAICQQFDLPFLRLVDGHWEKMAVRLRKSSNIVITRNARCCSSNLLFFTSATKDIKTGPVLKNSINIVNVNVLSLKSLSMRQVFNNYKHLTEKQIMKITDLPFVLKRQYFGPKWIWEK